MGIAAEAGKRVRIELHRGLTLLGRAVGENDAPVSELTVTRVGPGYSSPETIIPQDGTFKLLAVSADVSEIHISSPGLATTTLTAAGWPPTGEHDLGTIRLRVGARVAGRVRGPSGEAASGALLTLISPAARTARYATDPELAHAPSNEAGAFELLNLPPGRYELVASKEGMLPATLPLVLRAGEVREGIELQMVAGGSVEGRLTGGFGGDPGRVRVVIKREDEEFLTDGHNFQRVPVSAKGEFEFAGLDSGRYLLRAEFPQYYGVHREHTEPAALPRDRLAAIVQITVEVTASSRSQVMIDTDALCKVHGRLTGWTRSTADEQMTLDGNTGRFVRPLADDGSFDAPGVPPGGYILSLSSGCAVPVEIPPTPEHLLDLTLPVGSLSGVAKLADGAPAAMAYINARPSGSEEGGVWVRARADGTFVLRYLEPGTYTVYAELSGNSPPVEVVVTTGVTALPNELVVREQ